MFKKITLVLENGKRIVISAPANSAANRFVNGITFNGQPYYKNWLSHKALMEGANIRFSMTSVPDLKLGVSQDAYPYSFSKPETK